MGIFDKIKQILKPKEDNTSSKKANNNKLLREEGEKNTQPSIKREESSAVSESQSTSSKDLSIDNNFIEETPVHLKDSEELKADLDSIESSEIDGGNSEEVKTSQMSKSNISNNSLIDNSDSQKSKLDKSLDKTRDGFFGKMKLFFTGKNKVDDTFLDQLEEMLITSDVGVKTTIKIIDLVETFVAKNKYVNQEELKIILKNQIIGLLNVNQKSDNTENTKPYVILFVGVNGVGKTTTIAKLANFFKTQGKSVLIGAADTFRAAAIDQIDKWANQINVPIVKQKMGSDPAAVAYDTIQSAIASNIDYVIIDTAGRLHNKINLMSELEKISSSIGKLTHSAPHEVVLALDASTGQNALEQAKQFLKATNVTHLAITKLDGTAKGGVVISICDQLSIPIKYIGVGEKIEDIQLFNKMEFVESLFK